jgi:hypothetical protein
MNCRYEAVRIGFSVDMNVYKNFTNIGVKVSVIEIRYVGQIMCATPEFKVVTC